MIGLAVYGKPGYTIYHVVSEAVHLATVSDVPIYIAFNGWSIEVRRGDTPEDLLDHYKRLTSPKVAS